jgi:hypothetical protein
MKTVRERQDEFAEWVELEIDDDKYFLLRIAGSVCFPIYGQSSGMSSASVCYVFRKGSIETLPPVLDGCDLGRPDHDQGIKVFPLEHDWKYAAIGFSASEEKYYRFEHVVRERIALALELMNK